MATQCPKCQFDNASDSKFCKECGTQLGHPKDIPEVTKTIETPFTQFSPGTSLAGRYEIIKELGRGGMGEVYLAEDTDLKRQVAIKVLPQQFALDEERLVRFEREARLLASLNHPNIATIYGLEKSDGQRFLVMELVEGDTIAERIKKRSLPVEETLEICHQIAEALETAHEKGIIHRDLKPANIKVTPEGKVKVLDFGLAKAFETAVSGEVQGVDLSKSPTITVESSRSGVILGTVAYMSPEQARGKPLDKRTDIWSFGCVLYEALTGRQTYKSETISDSIAAILKSEPDWKALPEETPSKIRDLLQRCLQKNPNRRLHDIADGRILIEEAQEEGQFIPQVPPEVKIKKTFYRRWGSPATYLIIVVLTAILTWLIFRSFVKLPATAFSPNPTPVVVLMDSPIPNRVYDPETRANRGTNSDDITDTLRDLPIVVHKETTSSTWHREHQVLKQNPDLIVIHRSCFYDDTKLNDPSFSLHLSELTKSKLISFLGYIALGNPNTKFLVYSRSFWRKYIDPEVWRSEAEKRFPSMKGRMIIFPVPGGIEATFRDPKTATDLKRTVISMLDLPVEFEESLSESRKASKSTNSIAVLPFSDLSPQRDQEYFCDGMTDEIIAKLSRLTGWKVISRMSVMGYKNTKKDIKEIGTELDVSAILTGTIRKEKDNIRVSTQLIKVEDRSNIWSDIYNKKLESIFSIQSNIAENIAYALLDKLSPEVGEQLQKNPTKNLEAYNFYLLGRSSWNRRNEQGLINAIDYFEQALEIDPHYAAAYTGLADSYIALPFYSTYSNIEAFENAKRAAIKALEIDNSLSEAYTSLAFIKALYDWNREEAELDFKRALKANPNYATAHQWYALHLLHMGKFEDSENEMKKAIELDPLSLILKKDHGMILLYSRKFDQAIEILKNTIEFNPNFSRVHETLGRVFAEKSMFDEALNEFSQERNLLKTWDPRLETWIGITKIKLGEKSEGEAILNKMQMESKEIHIPPYFIALLNLSLGDQDQCFEWLQKAFKEKDQWLCYLKVDPLLDSVRQDPRLKELLQKMELVDSH